jgi:hypothetical protein
MEKVSKCEIANAPDTPPETLSLFLVPLVPKLVFALSYLYFYFSITLTFISILSRGLSRLSFV